MSKPLFFGGVGNLGPKVSWVPLKAAIDVFFDVGPLGPRMLWNSLRAAIDLYRNIYIYIFIFIEI